MTNPYRSDDSPDITPQFYPSDPVEGVDFFWDWVMTTGGSEWAAAESGVVWTLIRRCQP